MANWAAQLRGYRKETDNPKSRISSRRGLDAYNVVSDKAVDSDCGGYSLYSESLSGDNIATATKDLDRCARLLSDLLSNDKETTEMMLSAKNKQGGGTTDGRATKGGVKKSVSKAREKKVKGILAKKNTTRSGSKNKANQPAKKEVRKSLFSDTDSSMKSSVVAPPLNNSDAVGQAAVTSVATNAGPTLTTSKPLTTQPPPRSNAMNFNPAHQQTNRPLFNTRLSWSRFNHRIPSSTPTVATPSRNDKSNFPYEQHLHPTGGGRPQDQGQVMNPQDLANRLHSLPASEHQQGGHPVQHYAREQISPYRMPIPQNTDQLGGPSVQSMHYNAPQQLSPHRMPVPQNPYGHDVPQIYAGQNVGHQYNSGQAYHTGLPNYPTGNAYGSDRPLPNSPPEKLKSDGVPRVDSGKPDNVSRKPKRSKSKSKRSKSAERRKVDKATEMTVIEEVKDGALSNVRKTDVAGSEVELEKEEEETDAQQDSYSNVYVETNPRLHHPRLSPVSRRARLGTLKYLFNELRSSPHAAEGETERLLNEIEDNLRMLVPNVNTPDTEYGIELSLAMQPLRSENANLRRRLRIIEQQNRHRDALSEDEEQTKPFQNFNVIHLQMLNHTLEKQLKEERSAREMLQQQLKTVSVDFSKLSQEKTEMLQVLSNKDNSHIKSQQDWIEEAGRLRAELQSLEHEREDYRRKASAAQHEKEILTITLKEREKEVERLQDLVSTFRNSMRKLVEELSSSGPDYAGSGMVDQINRTLQLGASPRRAWYPVDMTPTRDSDAAFESFPHPSTYQLVPGLTSAALKSHNEKQNTNVGLTAVPKEVNGLADIKRPVEVPETRREQAQVQRSPGTDYGLDISATDYLGSPNIKGRQIISENIPSSEVTSRESGGFIDLGASTVQGILGPFADRMRHLSPDKFPTQSRSSGDIDDVSSADEDVTLTEHDNRMRQGYMTGDSSNTEQSRYSVTDYFEKYPPSKPMTDKTSNTGVDAGKENRPVYRTETGTSQFVKPAQARNEQPLSEIETVSNTASTVPVKNDTVPKVYQNGGEIGQVVVTPQHQLYKGTELDTSLSTIRESDDVISVISSAVTSSSATSINDREFRHGLANLDANIARIQASLKHVMQK